jgi:two-component system cell cycle response regulator DivK
VVAKPLALVIEDDQNISTIFAEALRAAEFEVEIIQDGRKALKRLADIVPALLVLDLHLPHVSGKQILEQIRADSRLAGVRVMVATADPLLADTLREEADLVLVKPISFSQMRDLATRLRPLDLVG